MDIIFINDITPDMPVGGKARSLVKLKLAGQRVPDGFVILPTRELDKTELFRAFDSLASERVAVRSSAVNEDGENTAWAGQLETKLNVGRDELIDVTKACRESAESARAQAYAVAHGQESGEVAVIVQRMLDSDISGVAFSKHPVSGQDAVVIEAVKGQGEQLVSGIVTPDTYVIGRSDTIAEQHLSGDRPILTSYQLEEVTQLTRSIAEQFGYPVDIEWAYDDSVLYALQARPITTL